MTLPTHRAALFDLDGTLVDSEPLHHRTTNTVLAPFGVELPFDDYRGYIGWAEEPYWEALCDRFALNTPIETLIARRSSAYAKLLHRASLPPMPGALDLLGLYRQLDLPCAIASAAPRAQIAVSLRSSGLEPFFAAVRSSHEDVERGKPSPDVYLAAADALDIGASACVAYEDSPSGVAAAKSAGCFVVGILTPYGVEGSLSEADRVLTSLAEVRLIRPSD